MGLPFENADYEEDQIGATKIPELTDVNITNLADNEILVYNSSSEVWENQAQGSTSVNDIGDITNVNITNLQDEQRLVYNSATSKWINSTITDNDTDNLNDLTDTLLTTPLGNNEVLKYNSTSSKWENGNLNLNNINDVNITSLQNGEVLKYNSTSSKWENSNRIDTLNELTDVVISSNQNNQVLKYNNSTGVYENQFVNLTELADTNITTLNNNNILIYNSSNQKWEPGNISYTETDPIFTAHTSYNITDGTGFLKNNGGTWSYDNNTYLTSANIYQLGGLTWSNLDDDELIRRSGSTSAEGAGMKLRDAFTSAFPQNVYNKTITYFNRVSPANIQFGAIDYEYSIAGFNQRIVPHSPLLTSSTDGLYLNYNTINTNVGINVKFPGKTFEVGTTLYVDDTNNRVGINIANPTEDLDIDGNIQLNSSTTSKIVFYDSNDDHEHAEIDATDDGTTGGQLQFYTKEDGGNVTERMDIKQDGAVRMYSDGVGLSILSTDATSQQGYIYNSSVGTKDLSIDSYSDITNKGIRFKTQGVQRLRIGYNGELGVGSSNDTGDLAKVLKSNGSTAPPSWANIYDLLYPLYSVFIWYNDTDWDMFPNSGQTWEEFGQGRVLVGRDTGDVDFANVGNTGGFKTHSLTQAEMPRHTHIQNAHSHQVREPNQSGGGNVCSRVTPCNTFYNGSNNFNALQSENTIATNQHTGGVGSLQTDADGQAHNILQPYIVVRYYRRIA